MQRKRTAQEHPRAGASGVNRLYAVLSKVNAAIVRIREPQALYEEACRIAVEDGGFLLAWIGFVEPGSEDIYPRARFGQDNGYLDTIGLSLDADSPEGRGPTGVALREGRVFINNDTANNPIMRPWRDEQLRRGFKSSASLPLKIEDRAVGVITLYADETDFFDDEEIALLTTLADDLSFALESAAKSEASSKLETATLLLAAAEQLNKSIHLHVLLERLADIVLRATSHSRVYVGLLAEDRSQVTFTPNLGDEALPWGTVVPWDGLSMPLQEVLTTGETRVVEYSRVPEGLRGIADKVNSRTALLVPIVFAETVLGHIALDDPHETKVFTDREIELVQGVASQAAVAIQNARLLEAEHKAVMRAEAAETEARNLIRHAPTGIYEIDFRGQRFMSVNDAMSELSGYSREELFAMSPFDLLDEPSRAQFRERIAKMLAGETPTDEVEYTAITKDGRHLSVVLNVTFRRDSEHHVSSALVIGHDVTRLLEAQRQAARELSRTKLLSAVALAASSSMNLAETAQAALDALRSHMNLSMGDVRALDEEGRRLRMLASFGYPPDLVAAQTDVEIEHSGLLSAMAVREARAVTQEDEYFTPERLAAVKQAGILESRYAVVPLMMRGAVVGTLALTFDGKRPFAADELELFDSVASTLAQAIANARLFEAEALARSHALTELERTTLLQKVAAAGASSLSLPEIGQTVLELTGESLGARTASMCTVDGASRELVSLAHWGPEKAVAAMPKRLPIDDESVWGHLVLCDLPLLTHMSGYSTPKIEERLRRMGADEGRWFVLPVISQGSVAGAFGLTFEGDRAFEPDELSLYKSIADILGYAFSNARLYQAAQEAARLNDALNAVNAHVHSTLEIDAVMQQALEAGVQALDCDSGAIEMSERGEWIVRYQTGFSAEDVGLRLSEDEAPNATMAARQGAPLAIEDMIGDEKVNVGFVKKYGLKSVLAVPLHAKGGVNGCALFYTSTATRHFTDAEIDFGRKLGSVVSLGLENARLYSVERDTAQTLQTALLTLPDSLRGVEFAPSYRSATESMLVGGDFYDIFELDDDRIGITIGDISGKGLGAAVLTSLVKDTIRAHANERGKTPAHVLTLTNNLVHRSTPIEVFATVFFGILDRLNGRLSFANAGHTTAAILKPGGDLQTLRATGPILGGFAALEFGESEARVGSNEILFLYTDGLTEARQGTRFCGEERLFDLLSSSIAVSARDVVDEVMADVLSFASGHLRDDLAILAVRRLEAPSAEATNDVQARQ